MYEHSTFFSILRHAIIITSFVFVMMVLVDYLNVFTRGKIRGIIKGRGFRQYFVTSLLGAAPGCLGAFVNVSFYVHGLISFGAMVGGMVATCGDEAFVMLAMFPEKAVVLIVSLFFIGIIAAWISDIVATIFKIVPCQECQLQIHPEEAQKCFDGRVIIGNFRNLSLARFLLILLHVGVGAGILIGRIEMDFIWMKITFLVLLSVSLFITVTVPEHYLDEHLWKHIAKKHLFKIFLWTFGALLVVDLGFRYWNIDVFFKSRPLMVLVIACVVGLVPQSGPHMVFVVLFAREYIPFSVLLASCIVQDGHGILPLLSYTVRDSLLIKLFNFVFGLSIGLILFFLGL